MAQSFDVCIRGAGVVGRALALLLARERLRVALVDAPGAPGGRAAAEEGDPPPADVRAYALNRASRDLLESLRGWPQGDAVTPVTSMEVQGDDGGAVDFEAVRQEVDALAWIVDVPALESQLAEAVRYQPLVEVVAAPPAAALTVVCEGKASATRAEFGVRFDTRPYPQSAVAARLRSSRPHGQAARQWFLPDGSILALLPTGGAAGCSVALVWSVARERAAALLASSAEEFARTVSEASALALGSLRLEGERAAWPLQWALADRWTGPMPNGADGPAKKAAVRSWALAGDAAHTVHPLAGQGLNLGLADARELAAVLQGRDYWRSPADPRLLRRYERARKAGVLPMGLATDGLQQLFAQADGPWAALRNWGMRGFDRSGPVKRWVARQAMGLR